MNTSKKSPLIDLTFIDELAPNDAAFKIKVLSQVIPIAKESLHDISEFLAKNKPNNKSIPEIIHKIKSTCSYLGMHKLYDAAIVAKEHQEKEDFIEKAFIFKNILEDTLSVLTELLESLRNELNSKSETANNDFTRPGLNCTGK